MNSETLEEFVDSLQNRSEKVGGKHNPISEKVKNQRKRLKVKKIYRLKRPQSGLYLFIVRNYKNTPKYRYFIALSLAGQSSDFLVYLGKDFALQQQVKLIQYGVYPEHNRVNLLGLKELTDVEDYEGIISLLNKFRTILKTRQERIKDLVVEDQKL